jgi:hypothetical protein
MVAVQVADKDVINPIKLEIMSQQLYLRAFAAVN